MSVYRCSVCSLIFQFRTEVESHLHEVHCTGAQQDAGSDSKITADGALNRLLTRWPTISSGHVTQSTHHSQAFGMWLRFGGNQVVLGIDGEIDIATAPHLAATINSVVERGYTDLVLDLVGVDFMSGAGLGVIASTASRLTDLGGFLSIRSPSPMVQRLFRIFGLMAVVPTEPFQHK